MSKEQFKQFAKKHPELANNVSSGNTTWQKLYELYDIYGENLSIWKEYITTTTPITSQNSIKDIFNIFKNLDVDSIQQGVTNIQKTIGLIQELGIIPNRENKDYEPRPIYKRFED